MVYDDRKGKRKGKVKTESMEEKETRRTGGGFCRLFVRDVCLYSVMLCPEPSALFIIIFIIIINFNLNYCPMCPQYQSRRCRIM